MTSPLTADFRARPGDGEPSRRAKAEEAPLEDDLLPEAADIEHGVEVPNQNGNAAAGEVRHALGPGCASHRSEPRATCRYCVAEAEKAGEAGSHADAGSQPCPHPEHRPSDWMDGGRRRCGVCDRPPPGAPAPPPPLGTGLWKAKKTDLRERFGGRSQDGAAFFLDAEIEVPAIWGLDGDVVWAAGEPLQGVGPQGVGKTTLMTQLALRRGRVVTGPLLGMPVQPSQGKVLYIAADRPRQAARSGRRMVTEADRELLESGLVIWRGPLPFDLGKCERGSLAEFVASECPDATDVFIDSLKDVAVKLTDDEVGARVNGEIQQLIAQGIEVVSGHHQRKAAADNKKPTKLADVYGSVWLTAGCGSVLLLWGEAGDAIVEASHLKQPSGEFGPAKVLHDHARGTMSLYQPTKDLLSLASSALGAGLTARTAAAALFATDDPSSNQVEKARGKLKRDSRLCIIEGSDPMAWRPKEAS